MKSGLQPVAVAPACRRVCAAAAGSWWRRFPSSPLRSQTGSTWFCGTLRQQSRSQSGSPCRNPSMALTHITRPLCLIVFKPSILLLTQLDRPGVWINFLLLPCITAIGTARLTCCNFRSYNFKWMLSQLNYGLVLRIYGLYSRWLWMK